MNSEYLKKQWSELERMVQNPDCVQPIRKMMMMDRLREKIELLEKLEAQCYADHTLLDVGAGR